MKVHVESVHDQISKFYCSECKMGSYFRGNLKKHTEGKHNAKGKILKVGCSLCDELEEDHINCNTVGNWGIHSKIHKVTRRRGKGLKKKKKRSLAFIDFS